VFVAVATPTTGESPPPLPDDEVLPAPVVVPVSSGNGHDEEPVAMPRGLVGAVEVKAKPGEETANPRSAARVPEPPPAPPSERGRRDRRDEDLRGCPICGRRISRDSRRCYYCDAPLYDGSDRRRSWDRDERDRDERADIEREPERRDRVPSRGVLVLVLGIISLLCLPSFFASPVGIVLGLIAWVMGHGDLNRINAHEMDPDGGLTRGGWICGMIGTILNVLLMLSCFGFMSMTFIDSSNHSAKTYNQQIQYKDAAPEDEDDMGPWGNPNRPVRKQAPPMPQQPRPPGGNNKEKGQEKF
jgi:hypothetical protein